MGVFYEQVNFGKGELGRGLQDRTDLEIYQQAVFEAVDYIVTGQGTLKAQGLGEKMLGADPALKSALASSGSHVVLNEGNSERYTIFTTDFESGSAKAFTYNGLPTADEKIEEFAIDFEVSKFLFTLNNEVYYKNAEGIFQKFEWFFTTGDVKYQMREPFTFPPAKLEATRITDIPEFGTKVDFKALKYRYDPRAKYIEIAFTNPPSGNYSITKIKASGRGWGFKNSASVNKIEIWDYQGKKIVTDTQSGWLGNYSRTWEMPPDVVSIKKIVVHCCVDTHSGGGAYLNFDFFNAKDDKWTNFVRDMWVKTGSGCGTPSRDNIGINPPSGDKPTPESLTPFFKDNLFEIDIAGNRARFDKLETYSASTPPPNIEDPFSGLVKIIARYELTMASGVDTLMYNYKDSKEEVKWVNTDPKYVFARKEFKEVYRAEIFHFYQDRLIIAGIPNYEDTVVMSAVNDFKDYSIRNLASDPITTKFSSRRAKVTVTGFSELASLLVFTNVGIWATPAKQIFVAGQSKFEFVNSLEVDPHIQQSLADNIVISGKNRNRIYQIKYNDDARKYSVKDLNIINNTILKNIRSIVPLDLGEQSEFTFVSIFGSDRIAILNLDDNENILGYTRMSNAPRKDFRSLIRILGKDYAWYDEDIAEIVPTKANNSNITFLTPLVQTEKGLLKYDDKAKIQKVTVKVIGDYNLKLEYMENSIEPSVDSVDSIFQDNQPIIDMENSRPLYFVGVDYIPVNRKVKLINGSDSMAEHEITSILFEIDV